ncbi:MAG: hypothetical protein WC757_03940 [Candidatus Paceibacterota bacterium]|jgi:hypothetical protein
MDYGRKQREAFYLIKNYSSYTWYTGIYRLWKLFCEGYERDFYRKPIQYPPGTYHASKLYEPGEYDEQNLMMFWGQLAEMEEGLALLSHASGQQGLRALYRNRVDSIPAQLPYRNRSFDSQGQLLHPKPSTAGQQTAIVVGAPGEAVHTDRDHRIKVQFHWQRGPNTQDSANSHSRLPHPRPGHSGAPANHQWVVKRSFMYLLT